MARPPGDPRHPAESRNGVSLVGPDQYTIAAEAAPRDGVPRVWHVLRELVLGPPLPSRLQRAERLGILAAVALLGSDMIASSVYGPEEMIRHLGSAGPGGVALAFPVALGIGLLLAIRRWEPIAFRRIRRATHNASALTLSTARPPATLAIGVPTRSLKDTNHP